MTGDFSFCSNHAGQVSLSDTSSPKVKESPTATTTGCDLSAPSRDPLERVPSGSIVIAKLLPHSAGLLLAFGLGTQPSTVSNSTGYSEWRMTNSSSTKFLAASTW